MSVNVFMHKNSVVCKYTISCLLSVKTLCATAHTRWPAMWMVRIFTIIFTLLQWLPGILQVFAVPLMWLLAEHRGRCSTGRGYIASSVSRNWGWRYWKIFPFKNHLLKSTPCTGAKPNSNTCALYYFYHFQCIFLYHTLRQLVRLAGMEEVGFLSSCFSILLEFWASPLLTSKKYSVHRIMES